MKAHPLNATTSIHLEDADERTSRHMRMCAELADLGMDLARRAAAKAATELDDQEEPQATEPSADSLPQPATKSSPLRTAALNFRAPTCKPISNALLFTRLATCVRACVALESRLAAGTQAAAARAITQTVRADSRRAGLRDAIHQATEKHAHDTELRQEIDRRLDEELAADPDHKLKLVDIVTNIFDYFSEHHGVEFDFSKTPDEYVGIGPDWRTDPNFGHRARSPP